MYKKYEYIEDSKENNISSIEYRYGYDNSESCPESTPYEHQYCPSSVLREKTDLTLFSKQNEIDTDVTPPRKK